LELKTNATEQKRLKNLLGIYSSILTESDNEILLGSFRNGFVVFDKQDSTYNSFGHKSDVNSLSHNHVTDAIIDDDHINVTTWRGGLNIYNRKT
jgi:hypothetical protein